MGNRVHIKVWRDRNTGQANVQAEDDYEDTGMISVEDHPGASNEDLLGRSLHLSPSMQDMLISAVENTTPTYLNSRDFDVESFLSEWQRGEHAKALFENLDATLPRAHDTQPTPTVPRF